MLQTGGFFLYNTTTLAIAPTATWNITADAGMVNSTTSKITNAGLLEKTGGVGESDISAGLVNTGSVAATSGHLKFLSSVVNSGTMSASHGMLDIATKPTGTGTVAIGASGTVSLEAGADASSLAQFLTTTGTLNLGSPLASRGTIAGFSLGNTIDLISTPETGYTYSAGVLSVYKGTLAVAQLHFSGSYTTSSFHLASDQHGGTMVTHT